MTKRDRGPIPAAINPNAFYRVDDIACILNVSRAIVYQLKNKGTLPPWENPFGMERVAGYTGQTLIKITDELFRDCKPAVNETPTPYRSKGRPRLSDMPGGRLTS